MKNRQKNWLVYIILCSDNSLYTGITTDLQRRFRQHETNKGARYFYGRKPLKIVFTEQGHDRSSAGKREYEIKSYNRLKKLALISSLS